MGQEIVRQLQGRHEVVGADLRPGPHTTHCGSLTDKAFVARAVRGAEVVVHAAALHAPHVPSHPKEAFVDTNIKGTLHLLEAATPAGVRRLVLTSSTSVYGHALEPSDEAAVWVTEALTPQPRDIYDITKLAAEQLCRHFADTSPLQVRVLRIGRCWDEPWPARAVYRLYRGLDVRDAAQAHVLAVENDTIQFGLYNVAAQIGFEPNECSALYSNAAAVIARHYPQAAAVFARRGWVLPPCIDRVYSSHRAQTELGYRPQHNFAELLAAL